MWRCSTKTYVPPQLCPSANGNSLMNFCLRLRACRMRMELARRPAQLGPVSAFRSSRTLSFRSPPHPDAYIDFLPSPLREVYSWRH